MDKKKLIKLLKDDDFKQVYEKLMLGKLDRLKDTDFIKLLSVSLILINSNDYETQMMGYEIILNYSIIKNDLQPLYEISNSLLNTPVIKLIQKYNKEKYVDNLYDEINSIAIDETKMQNGICYTNEQLNIAKEFDNEKSDSLVVAPTSFGKTELIKKYILDNYKTKNICIVVPKKVLVNQVRYDLTRMFNNIEEHPRIITHYDSIIRSNTQNIFVLTQERLFKLVYDRKNIEKFDSILVDEAHNIFSKDERAILLAKTIILLRLRNKDLIVKYFSPVINSNDSLQLKNYIKNIKEIKANPLIKTNKIYLADFDNSEEFYYNELFNTFCNISNLNNQNKYSYIINNSKNKNIIYCNTPVRVKKMAEELYDYLPELDNDDIQKIIKDISEYIDKNYDLIKYIKKGIVYHFGGMPDNVRIYIEECVKKYKFIKYIVCSSTLLEGVNMPFDCMFICEKKIAKSNMTYAQLKNLIGRVNRYNEIFNYDNIDLTKLISNIFFIKDKGSRDNYIDFIKENLKYDISPKTKEDKVDNPLLEESNNTIDDNTMQSLVNLSNYKADKINRDALIAKTEIGLKMITSNITEINVVENEEIIQERIEQIKENKETFTILEMIYMVFFENIEIISSNVNNIKRLSNEAARKYYDYMIKDRMNNKSLREKIYGMIYYWKNYSNPKEIFIGERWGTKKRNKNDRVPLYIDITKMGESEIINYAILRIKEEDNYIDYLLLKYIEILSQFGILSNEQYTLIKYGTNNPINIFFIRDGLSSELADLLVKKYSKYIYEEKGYYHINKKIIDVFNDNSILLNELKYYID